MVAEVATGDVLFVLLFHELEFAVGLELLLLQLALDFSLDDLLLFYFSLLFAEQFELLVVFALGLELELVFLGGETLVGLVLVTDVLQFALDYVVGGEGVLG